ncbi:hypothetical protein AhyVDH1_001 [Aeromonas phage AhyVDH1]|nr:hypothetical protein AhyVDH1_001 [Aeromonas phage AhyVDH1]
MALAALSGCTNQTPEEARANLERDYLESCRVWGVNFQAHEMGGAQKYKDRSLLALYDAQKKVARTPDLEALDCNGAFEEGVIEGRRRVSAGQIEMGGR